MKNLLNKAAWLIVVACFYSSMSVAQVTTPASTTAAVPAAKTKELRFLLNDDGSQYVKMTFANQTWLRYAQNNPGTTVNGELQSETFDISLRRTRMQIYGKTSQHTFFYLQIGQNNFNYLSGRKSGLFIHDALGEVDVNKHLALGAGLTAWTGFSRFSSPGVASIMALDAPLYLQATNDANDQFLRKLSAYAKGKLGKLDYRVVLSKPFSFTTSTLYNSTAAISDVAQFSPLAPKMQTSGYLSWQFKEQESNDLPYQVGTYLGKKKVMNVGAGVQYQPQAMWYVQNGDTLKHDMLLAALDFYYDAPLNTERGDAISLYAVVSHYDFGKGYIRNNGPDNDANGVTNGAFNGTGVAYPMIGTGESAYLQLGYLTPELSKTKSMGKLMPYVSAQCSFYDGFNTPMVFGDAGCSWYLDGSRSKLTFGVQNRPVYNKTTQLDGAYKFNEIKRLNSFILQYQVSI
jgi:hypothetical protein